MNRYHFSTAGVAQLRIDLAAICRVVDKSVGPGVAEAGLGKCLEGVQLLGLPVSGKTAADDSEADWEAWGGDDETRENKGESASGEVALGLWDVERRLFTDGEHARQVLDELGIDLLTEGEARALLRRRVELSG